MRKTTSFLIICLFTGLAACATAPRPDADTTAPITRVEAKAEACPVQILEAGANPEDCQCIEDQLYVLGQKPDALQAENDTQSIKELFKGQGGKRKIAIGLLRHDAVEHCGLFDPSHIVAKSL